MTEQVTPLYNTEIQCPVCKGKFEVTKIRSKFVKLERMDTDFCPYYIGINPLFYEVWVCFYCGYANHLSNFFRIRKSERNMVLDKISYKWMKRDFSGERGINKALEAYKLALVNLQVYEAFPSEFSKVCIRIAWIYRQKEELETERKFLEYALNYYERAYTEEHFPIGNLDVYRCMFIMGELSRRLGKYNKAVNWFVKLIKEGTDVDAAIPANLMDTAREMLIEIRRDSADVELGS